MGILCAFLVVIIHCRPNFEPGVVGWWLKEVLETGLTHIAVPCFFGVSGYMLVRNLDENGYHRSVVKGVRALLLSCILLNLQFYMFDLVGLMRLISLMAEI